MLTELKGVGDKTEKYLNELNINSIDELINFFPAKYVDFLTDGREIFHENEACSFLGEVVSNVEYGLTKSKKKYAKFLVKTGKHFVEMNFFHSEYAHTVFLMGKKFLFFGVPKIQKKIIFFNPKYESFESGRTIVPIYSLRGKIAQKNFSKILKNAFLTNKFESLIALKEQESFKLADYEKSLATLHFPQDFSTIEMAQKRILIEKLFAIMMQFRIFKEQNFTKKASLNIREEWLDEIDFPFKLTDGQKQAILQIVQKFNSQKLANVLLEGDVGSGKTAVAILAAHAICRAGGQVAVLVPTEVLCAQHFESFSKLLKCRVEKLTSTTKIKEKKLILEDLKAGKISVLIGTHSLLYDNVEFSNLKLAIIDEQHKFGVAQRAALLAKGEETECLVMSATPIPRTLSLTLFSDLDIIAIKEKPHGRKPIKSFIVPKKKQEEMFLYLQKKAKAGESIFIVCPSIESEEIAAAKDIFDKLKRTHFCDIPTEILHGRQKAEEKAAAIENFTTKKSKILISTTVVEVGVDVKFANIMVILSAERFGLSQLHQLRGRIGRNDQQAECYFCIEKHTQGALERLEILKNTENGFEIAEKDFQIRGAGDYIGKNQSGSEKDGLFANPKAIDFVKQIVLATDMTEEFVTTFNHKIKAKNKPIEGVVLN